MQPEKESFRWPVIRPPILAMFTYTSSSITRVKENELNVINCPVCRQRVQEPKKDIFSKNWAKSIPLNNWVWTMTVTVNVINLAKYSI